ncbi:response regulator [Patiriisocius marinus]|uniref:Response regulator n=1 Tax=Patiriisocius marinus TaxID=1397112 RepID=A0A5J4IY97_9FLAO|nr:response regulator [Patiriisocius marinus]GER58810.1 response regulator [Patiriisocius marinus]
MTNSSPIKLSCIIDDDDVYINLVKKIIDIKKLSENLLIFKNGQEALDYFKAIIENLNNEAFPEIILLDLNMPVMNGWNFLKEFTAIESPLKKKATLYIVSSSINQADINKSKEFSEVTNYLVKPVNIAEFEALFNSNKISA